MRRILTILYRPFRGGGPSWLSFIGQMKDRLWSIDFFRCESLRLKTHWALVVMDQSTRRIIGVGIHPAVAVHGRKLCRLFLRTINRCKLPHCLSFDNDPLSQFYQWQANLRILGIHEVKSIPYVSVSHLFIERLIGIIRRDIWMNYCSGMNRI